MSIDNSVIRRIVMLHKSKNIFHKNKHKIFFNFTKDLHILALR